MNNIYDNLIIKISSLLKVSEKLFNTSAFYSLDENAEMLVEFLKDYLGYTYGKPGKNGTKKSSNGEDMYFSADTNKLVIIPSRHKGNSPSIAYTQLFDEGNSNNHPLYNKQGRRLSPLEARYAFYDFLSIAHPEYANYVKDFEEYPKIHRSFFEQNKMLHNVISKIKELNNNNQIEITYNGKNVNDFIMVDNKENQENQEEQENKLPFPEQPYYVFTIKKKQNYKNIAIIEVLLKDTAIYGDGVKTIKRYHVTLQLDCLVIEHNNKPKKQTKIYKIDEVEPVDEKRITTEVSTQYSQDQINSKINIFFQQLSEAIKNILYNNPIDVENINKTISEQTNPNNLNNINNQQNITSKDPWADKRQKKKK